MANLTGADSFDPVYQIESTDSVQGGAGQIANSQAQSLANRTTYIRTRQTGIALRNGYRHITTSANFNITAADVGKMIAWNNAAGVVAQGLIDTIANVIPAAVGWEASIRISNTSNVNANVLQIYSVTDTIFDLANNVTIGVNTKIPIYPGEDITLVENPNIGWVIIRDPKTCNVGQRALWIQSGTQPVGWVLLDGSSMVTANYKRLADCVSPGAGVNFTLPNFSAVDVVWRYYVKI